MDRRTFLRGAALGVGAAAIGAPAARAELVNLALPSLGLQRRSSSTPVEHIVVLMMENRSVDHYLGWYANENPAFDAVQSRTYPDLRFDDGRTASTELWGSGGRGNTHGRGYADPTHGWSNGRVIRNGGGIDGWLDPRTGNDEFCLSYYDAVDVPVWAQLARGWQTYDRWFCSLLGPTYPNRYYLHSAQSGGQKSNDFPPQLAEEHPEWVAGWDWPTVWTLLENAGMSAAYYFNNLPVVGLWGHRHLQHARHMSEFYAAAASGTLPQVSFIDPWFVAPNGIANDDHPHADLRLGQAFLSDVVEAFVTSPQYRKGALVITYDEWGGFFDHVDPPRIADDRATPNDPGGADDFGQLGFRIPTTIVSPWTRGGNVDHTTYEHTSVLRFISENWGLPYLTTRHRTTNSIGSAFGGFTTFDPAAGWTAYDAPLDVTTEPILEDLANGQVPDLLPVDVVGEAADVLGIENPLDAPGVAASDLYRLAETGWFDGMPVNLDARFEDSYLRPRPELLAEVARAAGAPSTR